MKIDTDHLGEQLKVRKESIFTFRVDEDTVAEMERLMKYYNVSTKAKLIKALVLSAGKAIKK